MQRLCMQIAAVLAATTGAARADVGLPFGGIFAEQRSVTLEPVVFAPVAGQSEQTQTVTGTFPRGARDWVYLPVEVPAGVREIAVDYQYDRPTVAAGERGNALDIGVFDDSGIGLGNARGFRGWSGGFRTSFAISASDATPGYLPGPIHKGRWHVIFGPYSVAPQGLSWTATITLRYGAPGAAFVPSFAPERAPGRGRAWYRGDMHLHTVHSDGRRLPEEVAAGARAAGLDFIVSTDHNTSSSHAIRLFTDEGQIFQTVLPATGAGTVTWTTTPQVSRFVRAEVRRVQADPALPTAMVAFTNPIFLGK